MLSADELQQLTGYKLPGAQARWLRRHGWVFIEPARAGEHPRVARAYHDARLCGLDPATVISRPAAAPARKAGPSLAWMTSAPQTPP
jgi:hypothetical protein